MEAVAAGGAGIGLTAAGAGVAAGLAVAGGAGVGLTAAGAGVAGAGLEVGAVGLEADEEGAGEEGFTAAGLSGWMGWAG